MRRFYKFIEHAYTHANRTLLQLLLRDQQLIPRLRSLKHYFFLSQSSFLTHLLDLAHGELRKSAKAASLVKLQSLLDLALTSDGCSGGGGSERADDGLFREDVKVGMAGSGLYEWLLKVVSVSGVIGHEEDADADAVDPHKKEKEKEKPMLAIDALALDYTVKFPLSLVISRKTILRYQLLFRFLLHLKNVESSLCTMWIEHKTPTPWRTTLPPGQADLSRWRLRLCVLRARMLAWVQQILAFATFEVLEPNWRALEAKLARVTTVDQLLRDHVDFLDTCLKECMLTSSKLLKVGSDLYLDSPMVTDILVVQAYSKLIVTCSTFAMYTSMFTKAANTGVLGAPETETAMAKRWEVLSKFETNFNHWCVFFTFLFVSMCEWVLMVIAPCTTRFKVHLDCVQFYASSENVSLLPLVVRLNSVKTAS